MASSSRFTPGTPTPAQQQLANMQAILQAAQQALMNNAAYLALPSPTNLQVVAQVQALTRQVDGLIRLATDAFDATT